MDNTIIVLGERFAAMNRMIVRREAIKDLEGEYKALSILMFVLSEEACEMGDISGGRTLVQNAMRVLVEKGYARLLRVRNAENVMLGTRYVVSDSPSLIDHTLANLGKSPDNPVFNPSEIEELFALSHNDIRPLFLDEKQGLENSQSEITENPVSRQSGNRSLGEISEVLYSYNNTNNKKNKTSKIENDQISYQDETDERTTTTRQDLAVLPLVVEVPAENSRAPEVDKQNIDDKKTPASADERVEGSAAPGLRIEPLENPSRGLVGLAFNDSQTYTVTKAGIVVKDSPEKTAEPKQSKSTKKKKVYEEDDWQYKMAKAAYNWLVREDRLHRALQHKPIEETVQGFADVFDQINRLDHYSVDEIRMTMNWLVTVPNFYRDELKIETFNSLRKKVDKSDDRWIHVMFRQADKHFNGSKQPTSNTAYKPLREARMG